MTVVKRSDNGTERVVAVLNRGEYFGEQALLHQDKRLASIVANDPGTECLTLDRVYVLNYIIYNVRYYYNLVFSL